MTFGFVFLNPISFSTCAAQFCDATPEYCKKDGDKCDKFIEFLCTVGQLKTLDRRGWILKERNIPKPESIAGHMYRMAVIAMALEPIENGDASQAVAGSDSIDYAALYKNVDISKVVQMSLVHDIAECIVGDITPFDGVTEDEKHKMEMAAMHHLGKAGPISITIKF